MRNLIEKCDVYDLDRAVIDTLARAGIQPTEAMSCLHP